MCMEFILQLDCAQTTELFAETYINLLYTNLKIGRLIYYAATCKMCLSVKIKSEKFVYVKCKSTCNKFRLV